MNRIELMARLRASKEKHYVYILRRESGEPFYVGKGYGNRVLNHEVEAKNPNNLNYKVNIIRAIWKSGGQISYDIDCIYDNAMSALARERELIAIFGRHDLKKGPLANLLDGGEGPSNPSEESKLKHSATLVGIDGLSERAIGNRFLHKLWPNLRSAPVKPLSEFAPERIAPNREKMNLTGRQAAALAASAISSRTLLGAGVRLPRTFFIETSRYCLENGVGRDILVSGMASLIAGDDPVEDMFLLGKAGFDFIRITVDQDILLDAGVLMPD